MIEEERRRFVVSVSHHPPAWLRWWRAFRHPGGSFPSVSSEPWGSRWFVGLVPGTDDVHVFPLGDLIEHEVQDCACGPRVDPVEREDGSFGWIVTHDSLDGRELRE